MKHYCIIFPDDTVITITMDVPFFGAMFVARRLQNQRTCQHVQGRARDMQSTMVSCSFFAQNLHGSNNSFSCPCRHEPGNPMARHPCMQLANLGSNKAFLMKFTQEVPLR